MHMKPLKTLETYAYNMLGATLYWMATTMSGEPRGGCEVWHDHDSLAVYSRRS
jgi:hypothetical protein